MASDQTRRTFQVFFGAEGFDPGVLTPARFRGSERISGVGVLEVDVGFDPGAVDDIASLLRKNADVLVVGDDGTGLRAFSGVVTAVREKAAINASRVFATITMESTLALLRYTTDWKIFQDMSSKDIASQVLAGCGVPASAFRFKLSGACPKREVCTQLDESALAFVTRILAEDGIFFFPERTEDGEVITFSDDSSSGPALLGGDVQFGGSSLATQMVVTHVGARMRVRPKKVTLRDHDFKRPSLGLEVTAESDSPLGREHYDYPGRYVDPSEGKRRAKICMDAMTAAAAQVHARSSVFGMTPGHLFALHGTPGATHDGDWLVVSVEHSWDEAHGYENELVLLPKSVPHRSAWPAQKPLVPGPQCAWVTGPSAEEIHTDEYGRVKVQYVWDRYGKMDDKSSCWVRVGQMHSSGSVAIPRVGWEVLVAFEDGDADKPYVLGRIYNARQLPPGSLPAQKTQSGLGSFSSPGGQGRNEIRTDDGAGSESFAVQAQKDMNVHTANNKQEKVTNNETIQVNVNQTIQIGANQTTSIGSSSEVSVKGAQKWTVGASRTKTVSSDETETIEGSRTQTVGAGHTVLTPLKSETGTQSSLTETVAACEIDVAGQDVDVSSIGSASITVGAAMISLAANDVSATTLGARSTTVGGACIRLSGAKKDVSVGGAKASTVGGVLVGLASSAATLHSKSSLRLTVGGIALFNAGGIVLKVGGSTLSIGGGGIEIKASTIKLTATGPLAELIPLVDDN